MVSDVSVNSRPEAGPPADLGPASDDTAIRLRSLHRQSGSGQENNPPAPVRESLPTARVVLPVIITAAQKLALPRCGDSRS